MADSPEIASEGVVTLEIKVNGQTMSDSYQVLSIITSCRVNRVPYAIISIEDGSMAEGTFTGSDADDFKPGTPVEIYAGYQTENALIFGGIVVKHGVTIRPDGKSSLEIELKDNAVKMTIGRKNVNYVKKKDSEIISSLIQNAGLKADVTATTVKFEEMVQYYCTDWDFMMTRAEINGMIVVINNGTVAVKKPLTSEAEALTVTYGDDIIEFNASIDARNQYKKVKSIGWDIQNQKVLEADGTDPGWDAQGNLGRAVLAETASPETFTINTTATFEQGVFKNWADAQFVKSNLSKITGMVKISGSSLVKTGSIIKLSGVGARFEGKVLVTGVTHEIADNFWSTKCEFGIPESWFAEKTDIAAPMASGLMPGVNGLQVGKIMKLDGDPLQLNRIQVKLPVLKNETEGVWARLAQFYATNSAGAFFVPEIDDEVIVGYFNNDPSQPVILGSLYSSKIKPPYEITKDNFKKAILSKEKLTIEFDDENKIITIKTPGNNSVIFSDKDKKITVSDQNKNTIILSDSGIAIDSAKDIKISAKGKIDITATGALTLSSTADTAVKGNNVNVTANIGAVVKGSANAEISASGQTTVKGAMVMIN
jgi:Rhs element Vgr protein